MVCIRERTDWVRGLWEGGRIGPAAPCPAIMDDLDWIGVGERGCQIVLYHGLTMVRPTATEGSH